ncbi:MAG: hypothetical protein IT204_20940 [Fimbriimonadaceae bacterium]|nr:hypothetical protein [Fimbriimonadaceae bacterium]
MVRRPWLLLLLLEAVAMGQTTPARFVQDRFAIGLWVDPPVDDRAAERYAELAAANFTVVLGGFGARTAEQVKRQLELCEQHDLRAIVARAGLPPEQLPTGPALWGYMVRDEPNCAAFAGLRAEVDALRAARPGKLAYINLFPNYASPAQLGAATYEEHIARFQREVVPDVLSMDHYPPLQPQADGRDGYCANLAVLREQSLAAGVPFWNFFNTMPFGPHWDPTEADLRWQVHASLAYGAKGVLYFCYWTPRGDEFPKGGAILTAEGRRTRHYGQAQRINGGLKQWGPTLLQLTSRAVYRLRPGADPAEALAGCPLTAAVAPHGDYLIGSFTHADGRRAVLLVNYDRAFTSWPTVSFDVPPAAVLEVSTETGAAAPVVDDSPDLPGLQLSLDSGGARLFLLPPA